MHFPVLDMLRKEQEQKKNISVEKDDFVQGTANNTGEKVTNGTNLTQTNGSHKAVLSNALNEKIKKRKVSLFLSYTTPGIFHSTTSFVE